MDADKNTQGTLKQLVIDRRAVLRSATLGGSAVAATVALAACGKSSDSGAESSTSAAGAGSTSAGGAAKATVATSEVPVGGGVILEQKYVVTQPTAGSYKAFSAICTHQGCPVTSVEDGVIKCPCHSSHFSITDGKVEAGPATEPLPSYTATVEGSNVDVT